jgi:hypothetical protein
VSGFNQTYGACYIAAEITHHVKLFIAKLKAADIIILPTAIIARIF